MTTNLLWLRRDLRRRDHPALAAAAAEGARVLPVVVIDPDPGEAGAARRGWLAATLAATAPLFEDLLCLRMGDPMQVLVELARESGAQAVHVTRETRPDGRRQDAVIERRLRAEGVDWVATGTPYAVSPGRVHSLAGSPYRVFTAFAKAWRAHGWLAPAPEPAGLELVGAPSSAAATGMLERWLAECPVHLPAAGEGAAIAAWARFRAERLAGYAATRDRPDLDTTSRLSPHLAVGALHPRTLLDNLLGQAGEGVDKFVTELAWREFHADLLWHQPSSETEDLTPALAGLAYDEPGEQFAAWRAGRTGYPLVDAGMRQLLTEGWMHNRVRMVAASFLVKDLHLPWQLGARHFQELLIDFDLASNTHNWQWVAGTGTDAAPYPRVFNPVTQSESVDPEGSYVRRYLPELAHLDGRAALHPWGHPDGYARGYPARIVDHAAERLEALTRHRLASGR